MISFPRGTEMFHFPRLPSRPYVFRARWRRTTGAGFSYSGIHGSLAVQRLTVAYRSRPRPSSTPGAKASTICPYYLDGDHRPARPPGPAGRRCPAFTTCQRVRFSRTGEERARRGTPGSAGLSKLSSAASSSVDILGAPPIADDRRAATPSSRSSLERR